MINKIKLLIETILVYYYQKLLKRFSLVRCKICFNDRGVSDLCYFPISHVFKNKALVICDNCKTSYTSVVYDPCPYCIKQRHEQIAIMIDNFRIL